MRTFIILALLVPALTLSLGCSMESGDTPDPVGFEQVQGLDQATAPAASDLEQRFTTLENENAQLRSELEALRTDAETTIRILKERIDSLEAGMPIGNATLHTPVKDMSPEQMEEFKVREGVEEIYKLSQILLQKMEPESIAEQADTEVEIPQETTGENAPEDATASEQPAQ